MHACVPEALTILDTEDLHCLRKARQQFDVSDPNSQPNLKKVIRPDVLASIYRCDVSLIISEFEMQLLQNNFRFLKPCCVTYLFWLIL